MNTLHRLRDEATCYLRAGYRLDEVVANIAVHNQDLDEFQLEDLEKLIVIWRSKLVFKGNMIEDGGEN